MKTRESGMPAESMWDTFFQPEEILDGLGIHGLRGVIVDLGCGYGTFTIPAARMNRGMVFAIDIEADMIALVKKKSLEAGLTNVQAIQRDFIQKGTGLPESSCSYVMLFNILHAERPEVLLREAHRVLAPGGKLAIVHWNYDPATPRGPSMAIRPRPEQCVAWAESVGFRLVAPGTVDLPPYHYGMVLERLPPSQT